MPGTSPKYRGQIQRGKGVAALSPACCWCFVWVQAQIRVCKLPWGLGACGGVGNGNNDRILSSRASSPQELVTCSAFCVATARAALPQPASRIQGKLGQVLARAVAVVLMDVPCQASPSLPLFRCVLGWWL